MKNLIMILSALICVTLTFTSCDKSSDSLSNSIQSENEELESKSRPKNFNPDQEVIVMAAPSVHNDYYAGAFDGIVSFQVDFANSIEGRDAAIILVDSDTRKFYEGRVPNYVLVDANMEDIWIRDFGSVLPDKQIKFNYLPNYNPRWASHLIDNAFEGWIRDQGLSFGKKSNLILDGGNVVDNGAGRVIITDRFLFDNPRFTKASAKRKIKKLLGVNEIAIIKESPGDATGHADGMVMWTDENTILLHDQPRKVKRSILRELKRSFPGVEIIIVPDYYKDEVWNGFSSACNIFVNSLVTKNFIYVPTFNSSNDSEMIAFIQSHTNKNVVPVAAENVCFMGGSVRCLTW